MLRIVKTASCTQVSPGAVQLRRPGAAGEIPDTVYVCIAVIHFDARLSPLGDTCRRDRYSGIEKHGMDHL